MAQHTRRGMAARPGYRARMLGQPDLGIAAITAMALAGIAVSIYLIIVHYAGAPLVCTTGGTINCTQVTTSVYSVVPGTHVPVAIPGLLWFLVSGGLAIAAWRAQTHSGEDRLRISLLQLAWAATGLIAVLYLVYVEIVRLHAICEWCTVVHVLTLLTFLVALRRAQQLAAEA